MQQLGRRLGATLQQGDLISLNGVLGAGKTTLTKAIGEGVGVKSSISSPTFLIARTHQTSRGIPFVHIDAYRLSNPRELDDLDIDYSNSISVIEWGKGFTEGLAESILEIEIERFLESEDRKISISGPGIFAKADEMFGDLK